MIISIYKDQNDAPRYAELAE